MFQSIDMRQNFYYRQVNFKNWSLLYILHYFAFIFSYTYDLTNTLQFNNQTDLKQQIVAGESIGDTVHGFRNKPCSKFLWNEYLLKPIQKLNYQWLVYLVHGYLSQSNILFV